MKTKNKKIFKVGLAEQCTLTQILIETIDVFAVCSSYKTDDYYYIDSSSQY